MVGIFNAVIGTQQKVNTYTAIANTTSTNSTIVIPTSAVSGDIVVLFDRATSNSNLVPGTAPAAATPTGFTNVISTAVNGASQLSIRSSISYKQIVSGDSGSTLTGMAAGGQVGTNTTKVLIVFRPDYRSTDQTINASGATTNTNGNTVSNQTLNTSTEKPLLGIVNYTSSAAAISTRTSTGITMTEVTGSTAHYVRYYISPTWDSPSNGTISMNTGTITPARLILQTAVLRIA